MGTCEVCGNKYEKAFEVRIDGATHVFDCFECAIHQLAPRCAHCQCAIIGHGVDDGSGTIWCCAHCQREHGTKAA
jgi:hypothetical protein